VAVAVVVVARSRVTVRSDAAITTYHFDVERLTRTQHQAPSERADQLIASCARRRTKKTWREERQTLLA
jgi:hypothetical protein